MIRFQASCLFSRYTQCPTVGIDKEDCYKSGMRTKVIETKLVPAGDITAITLFGLVFTRDRKQITPRILNHELIHCQQQLELLYIPFFILYVLEWLAHLVKYRKWWKAYQSISFEREAYANDANPDYLAHRKPYSWLRYIRTVQ